MCVMCNILTSDTYESATCCVNALGVLSLATPLLELLESKLEEDVRQALAKLTRREEDVLRDHFGIGTLPALFEFAGRPRPYEKASAEIYVRSL